MLKCIKKKRADTLSTLSGWASWIRSIAFYNVFIFYKTPPTRIFTIFVLSSFRKTLRLKNNILKKSWIIHG